MTGALEVHTAFPDAEAATAVARTLVAERLCACAQVVPGLASIYVWEGMLRHDAEALLLLKTLASAWPALRDRLSELHPYSTPEIVALPIEHASYEYLAWLKEHVAQP
jgi:periplasmic divalent cation tolerance protein